MSHPMHPMHDNYDDLDEELQAVLNAYDAYLHRYPLWTKALTAACLAWIGDAVAQYIASRSPAARSARGNSIINRNDKTRRWSRKLSFLTLSSSSSFVGCCSMLPCGTTCFCSLLALVSFCTTYDWNRGVTFAAFGFLYTGAFQHVWFAYLSTHVVSWGAAIGAWSSSSSSSSSSMSHSEYEASTRSISLSPPTAAKIALAKLVVNQFGMVPFVYMPLFFLVTSQFQIHHAWQRCKTLYARILMRNYSFWLPLQLVEFACVEADWQIPLQCVAALLWTILLSMMVSTLSSKSTDTTAMSRKDANDTPSHDISSCPSTPTQQGDGYFLNNNSINNGDRASNTEPFYAPDKKPYFHFYPAPASSISSGSHGNNLVLSSRSEHAPRTTPLSSSSSSSSSPTTASTPPHFICPPPFRSMSMSTLEDATARDMPSRRSTTNAAAASRNHGHNTQKFTIFQRSNSRVREDNRKEIGFESAHIV